MSVLDGCPGNVAPEVIGVAVLAHRFGCYVTATTNGVHAINSWHKRGRALDAGANSQPPKVALQRHLYTHFASELYELFGPQNGACVKNGVRITLPEGSALENQHDNHTHVAARSSKRLRALAGAGTYPTLRVGDNGASVRRLQAALGYLHFLAPGNRTGHFGPRTLAAVKKFQRRYKLKADGVVGTQTWSKLHAANVAKHKREGR
jgi:murein L,D-transpeptidase YcbB/YkuD